MMVGLAPAASLLDGDASRTSTIVAKSTPSMITVQSPTRSSAARRDVRVARSAGATGATGATGVAGAVSRAQRTQARLVSEHVPHSAQRSPQGRALSAYGSMLARITPRIVGSSPRVLPSRPLAVTRLPSLPPFPFGDSPSKDIWDKIFWRARTDSSSIPLISPKCSLRVTSRPKATITPRGNREIIKLRPTMPRLERERRRTEGILLKEAMATDAALDEILANDKAIVLKHEAEAATATVDASRLARSFAILSL